MNLMAAPTGQGFAVDLIVSAVVAVVGRIEEVAAQLNGAMDDSDPFGLAADSHLMVPECQT